jgi:hypothetical protein
MTKPVNLQVTIHREEYFSDMDPDDISDEPYYEIRCKIGNIIILTGEICAVSLGWEATIWADAECVDLWTRITETPIHFPDHADMPIGQIVEGLREYSAASAAPAIREMEEAFFTILAEIGRVAKGSQLLRDALRAPVLSALPNNVSIAYPKEN